MKAIQITTRQAQELANKLKAAKYPDVAKAVELKVREAVQPGLQLVVLDQDVHINAYKIYISGEF